MNMHKRKGKAFKTPKESRERNQRTDRPRAHTRPSALPGAPAPW
jgi:hypothetical protein